MFRPGFESVLARLLRIDSEEVSFDRRGFYSNSSHAQACLETVGTVFLDGYHLALRETRPNQLAKLLESVEESCRGFAFEGAAMALALLDHTLFTRRSRWRQFLSGPGVVHQYMLHVGYGWAIARLPWLRKNPSRQLSRCDPLLCWLVLDGYGFHQGYFDWPKYVSLREVPSNLSGYALRAFDQGLGRSLWFVAGADADKIVDLVAAYSKERQPDLWSGVGLASAYAGGADCAVIKALRQFAERHQWCLAQGAAFAAKARQLAKIPADHTAMACEVLCGMSPDSAAAVTDECLAGLPNDGIQPAYECWRQRIQSRMAAENFTIERRQVFSTH